MIRSVVQPMLSEYLYGQQRIAISTLSAQTVCIIGVLPGYLSGFYRSWIGIDYIAGAVCHLAAVQIIDIVLRNRDPHTGGRAVSRGTREPSPCPPLSVLWRKENRPVVPFYYAFYFICQR